MNHQLLGLLAETPIHPGSGQSTGFVDLPVSREKTTDYPVIPGSSVKGALLDLARQRQNENHKIVFGTQNQAGALIVSDARILLLPARSMTSSYRWLICPHVIERLLRDCRRAGHQRGFADSAIPEVQKGSFLGHAVGAIYLEERQFTHEAELPEGLAALIAPFIAHEQTRARLSKQLTVLHDDDFAWFARHGLTITARNQLNDDTKASENLWYEETLPPDTVLYAILAERRQGAALADISTLFADHPYLQLGGNETVGQGWFAVSTLQGGRQ